MRRFSSNGAKRTSLFWQRCLSFTLMAAFFVAPLSAIAAPIPTNKISLEMDGFVISENYALVAGQPTAAGEFADGNVGAYEEKACVPVLITVKNEHDVSGEIEFRINYDYQNSGQNPKVGVERFEAIAGPTDPFTADNLNDFTYFNSELTTATSFPSTSGSVTALITGPFGGSAAGTQPTDPSDTDRHYNVVLNNVLPSEEVFVLACARLGKDAGQFPGSSMSVSSSKNAGGAGGQGNVPISTNELLELPTLVVQKVVSGGTALASQWTYNVNPMIGDTSNFNMNLGEDAYTFTDVQPGTYSITEPSGPANYTFTGAAGACTFANQAATVQLQSSTDPQTVTCELINTFAPPPLQSSGMLTVVKEVVGGSKLVSDFQLFVNGQSVTSGASVNLTPGQYTVSETPDPEYVGSFSGDCDVDGNVDIAADQARVCILTNTAVEVPGTVTSTESGTITVVKEVINDEMNNPGTKSASDFQLFIGNISVVSGAPVFLPPGSYVVSETADPGYVGTFSGDCDADGNITIAAGESKTCVLTNNDVGGASVTTTSETATLTVIVKVINDEVNNPGTNVPGDFWVGVMNQEDLFFAYDLFQGVDEPGHDVTLSSGQKFIVDGGPNAQNFPPYPPVPNVNKYTKSASGDCFGEIVGGEELTCTITYDDVADPAVLHVITKVVNDDGTGTSVPGDFLVGVMNQDDLYSAFDLDQGEDEPGHDVVLVKGQKFIVDGGPNLQNYPQLQQNPDIIKYTKTASGTCMGEIQGGEDLTCTITYDDIPKTKLTVITHVENLPSNPDPKEAKDFGISVMVPNSQIHYASSDKAIDFFPGVEEPGYTVTLEPEASYIVDSGTSVGNIEDFPNVPTFTYYPNYTKWAEGDCWSPDVNKDGFPDPVGIGQEYVCHVYFKELATSTLTVITNVINDDGGTSEPSDFLLGVMNLENLYSAYDLFQGSTTGHQVTLLDGQQFIVDGGPNLQNYPQLQQNPDITKYTKAASGDCMGTLSGGENLVCTITYNDIGEDDNDDNDDGGSSGGSGGSGGGRTETSTSTATLIVIKNVINNEGGTKQASDFTISVTGTSPSLTSFAGNSSGTTITIGQGFYAVDEVDTFGYTKTLDPGCSGSILAGETKTCVITNNDASAGGGGGGGGGGGTVNIPNSTNDTTPSGSSNNSSQIFVSGDNSQPPVGLVLGATDESLESDATSQLPRTGMGIVSLLPSLLLGLGMYVRRRQA